MRRLLDASLGFFDTNETGSKVVAWLGLGVPLGVILADAFGGAPTASLWIATGSACVAFLLVQGTWRLWAVAILALTIGLLLGADRKRPALPQDLSVEGVAYFQVNEVPQRRGDRARTTISLLSFGQNEEVLTPETLSLELRYDSEIELEPHARYLARIRLEGPRSSLAPGARDQRAFFGERIDGRAKLLGDPVLESPGPPPRWFDVMATAKAHPRRLLKEASPFGILPALVLGEGREVDPIVRERFSRCGLAHVLAVSGLHFGLVAASALWILSRIAAWIPWTRRHLGARRTASLAALPLLALYVVFVGGPVSALRAFLMASLALSGFFMKRSGDPYSALGFAALVLTLFEPSLALRPGFQLSFSAVLGLLWTQSHLDPLIKRALSGAPTRLRGPLRWLITASAATLGASVATAPFTLLYFNTLSLSGSIANLWIVPLVSFVLLPLGFLALGLFPLSPWLAEQVAALGGWVEGWTVTSVDWIDRWIPATSLQLPDLSIGAFLVISAFSLFLLWAPASRLARAGVLGILGVGMLGMFWGSNEAPLRITFLPVGQGDSVFLELPDGRTMLIDAGGETWRDTGAQVVVPAVMAMGYDRLSWLVLTHPDLDHMGGMSSVVRALRPEVLFYNGDLSKHALFIDLMVAAVFAGTEVRVANSATTPIEAGRAKISFLWPPPGGGGDRNHRSLVLQVQHGSFSALLTGDADIAAERAILKQRQEMKTTLLKAGHHGSRTSTGDALLKATSPRWVIFCVGKKNRYGMPHPEVLQRVGAVGAKGYRTDQEGAIRVISDGRRARLEVFR